MLTFFAEDRTADSLESVVEHLFHTVEEFRGLIRNASREVMEQQDRFAGMYSAVRPKSAQGGKESKDERTQSLPAVRGGDTLDATPKEPVPELPPTQRDNLLSSNATVVRSGKKGKGGKKGRMSGLEVCQR